MRSITDGTLSSYTSPARQSDSPPRGTPSSPSPVQAPTPETPAELRTRAPAPAVADSLVKMAFPLSHHLARERYGAMEADPPPLQQRPCQAVGLVIATSVGAASSVLLGLAGEQGPDGGAESQTAFLLAGLVGLGVGVCAWLLQRALRARG